jgi:hypothetical protein
MAQYKIDTFHLGQFTRLKFRKTADHGDPRLRVDLVRLAYGRSALFLGNSSYNAGADYIYISRVVKMGDFISIFQKFP